jgi:hypothetical protein
MESIIIQPSLDPFCFLFHRSECSPMHPVLKPLNYLYSSKLHPYRNWYCYTVKLFLTLALVISFMPQMIYLWQRGSQYLSVGEEAEWASETVWTLLSREKTSFSYPKLSSGCLACSLLLYRMSYPSPSW